MEHLQSSAEHLQSIRHCRCSSELNSPKIPALTVFLYRCGEWVAINTEISKYMDFQIVISATEKNEAEKETRGYEARGRGVAILKRVVRKPHWVTVKQIPANGKMHRKV